MIDRQKQIRSRASNGKFPRVMPLQPHVNILSDEDWIIHLDEETIVTPDSVKGVFNFAAKGEFHFGQGVITYTNLGIENPILTLADSLRVANDYGLIR